MGILTAANIVQLIYPTALVRHYACHNYRLCSLTATLYPGPRRLYLFSLNTLFRPHIPLTHQFHPVVARVWAAGRARRVRHYLFRAYKIRRGSRRRRAESGEARAAPLSAQPPIPPRPGRRQGPAETAAKSALKVRSACPIYNINGISIGHGLYIFYLHPSHFTTDHLPYLLSDGRSA